MAMSLVVLWHRCRGGVWADLFRVDLAHPHFNDINGVYVIWHGGPSPAVVKVGRGPIRVTLESERQDPAAIAFRDKGLFVSWAAVPPSLAEGVERFLLERLQPKVGGPVPQSLPVVVNLPGAALGPGQPALISPPDAMLPGQAPPAQGETPVAPPAPPGEIRPRPAPDGTRAPMFQGEFEAHAAHLKAKAGAPPVPGAKSAEDEATAMAVKVVQFIIERSVAARASDIHLEPFEDRLRVRLRIDGILEESLSIPNSLNIRVVPRIRVMAGLDPEQGRETAKPQEGRMVVAAGGEEVDMRLSTLPTNYGEKAVLRIIRRATRRRQFSELGMSRRMAETVARIIERPQGMIIVTGPAGNGKSTTLYAILDALNTPSRNIITLEDPVELVIPGINQSAVRPQAGFTFASGLKAILRQDPNVIMVGEIRDSETAEIAMSAALTGHLLFSTLHTNSGIGAVTRLLDMGLEPFVVASALTGVMAQRLVRRLCPKCREPYAMSEQVRGELAKAVERAGIRFTVEQDMPLYRGKGCPECRNTGYVGRLLLFELVQITPRLRDMIIAKKPLSDLQAGAVAEGAQTLLEDGLWKVREGETSLDEVLRMVAVEA